mmetsp:Transcript_74747/g.132525  ORF Transcript_74747/g.132525 Transcript_74747/m.132525 type:complete len:90 (+) Transcript_74747:630-899(+)
MKVQVHAHFMHNIGEHTRGLRSRHIKRLEHSGVWNTVKNTKEQRPVCSDWITEAASVALSLPKRCQCAMTAPNLPEFIYPNSTCRLGLN